MWGRGRQVGADAALWDLGREQPAGGWLRWGPGMGASPTLRGTSSQQPYPTNPGDV